MNKNNDAINGLLFFPFALSIGQMSRQWLTLNRSRTVTVTKLIFCLPVDILSSETFPGRNVITVSTNISPQCWSWQTYPVLWLPDIGRMLHCSQKLSRTLLSATVDEEWNDAICSIVFRCCDGEKGDGTSEKIMCKTFLQLQSIREWGGQYCYGDFSQAVNWQ